MQNNLWKNGLVLLVLFISVGANVAPSMGVIAIPSSSINIFYVGGDGPGNYSKIQDAINDANEGDTIIVYSGEYYERPKVDKQLSLIGVKKEDDFPLIIGGKNDDVIVFYADGCNFENFRVKNGEGGYGNNGIVLYSNNNKINNCLSFETGTGLLLTNSNNNIISNNKMTGGWNGIKTLNSSYNIFSNNDIYEHNEHEINVGGLNNKFYHNFVSKSITGNGFLVSGSNHFFYKNIIESNNRKGIQLSSTKNITLIENSFVDNGIAILGGSLGHWTSHTFINNSVNDKPIYYYTNKKNITVPEDAGQVILANCTNFTLRNLEISKTDIGISLKSTSNTIISNNSILSSKWEDGINLIDSSDNYISKNTITNHLKGIVLFSSEYNIISQNIVEDCDYGIWSEYSDNTLISDCNVSNNRIAVGFKESSNNIISHNNISSNEWWGIFLWGLYNEILNNTISKNKISSNSREGIYLTGNYDTKIEDNIVENNNKGISIEYSEKQDIKNNTFSKNNYGVYAQASENLKLYGNTISGNIKGIYLEECFNNYITHNNFIHNIRHALVAFDYFLWGYEKNQKVFSPSLFKDKIKDTNTWYQNFWNRARVFPKIILVKIRIYLDLIPELSPMLISILPYINIDQEPLDSSYSKQK